MTVAGFHLLIVPFVYCLFLIGQTVEGACRANGIQYVDDADVRFALMLPLRSHESGSLLDDCQISSKSLQHYLAVEWLVDRINSYNNFTGYIPGVKIGYTSYDDCGESIYSARHSVSFLNNSLSYMSSTCAGQTETVPHVAIIGPGSSSSSLTVSSLLKDHPIPIISPMSTVSELSDKNLYPTFMRTVPSDTQQMTLVVDMLERLQWTYIAVVYQDDDYGKSGKNILTQKAKERGICIHKEDLILPQVDRELDNHFENILMSAQGNSIAVVIITNTFRAEQLLYALETRLSSNKRGLHFIVMGAVNTDVSIFKNERQGHGTLAISTASGLLKMNDLKAHLNQKFKQVAAGSDQHGLIKEFIETHGRPPDQFVEGDLDAFLPATINAIMALVEGLKNLHGKLCIDAEACSLMREKIKGGELLKQVKESSVKYSNIPKDIVPTAFHDSQFSFSFNANGDVIFGDSNPSYTIYSFDASEKKYKLVGSYKNEKISLDVDQIQWWTPQGVPMKSGVPPTSMCAGDTCKDCQNNGRIPVMLMEGDVYIVGIFSLHTTDSTDPFKCGMYRSIAQDAIVAEGFLFAIKELRTRTGIRFGAIGFDACYSQLRITSILTDYFSDISPVYSEIFPHKISRDKVVGVIGCLSSGCSISTATFFKPLNIPMVSYASSSPDLDDKVDFPNFLRTVPSDEYQAQVMVSILKEMNWEYVGLLYVDNNYGAKGMRAFRQIVDAEGSGICAAKEIAISEKETVDEPNLYAARRNLTSQNVKVVVFFGIDTRFKDFITIMEKDERYGSFIFLASEDWGINEGIKNAGVKSSRGSITLKLQTIGLESEAAFKTYLLNKRPIVNDNNVWFREYWQNLFECRIRGGFHEEFEKECDVNQKLDQSQVAKSLADQRVRHVINAVFSMGKGLNQVIEKYCKSGLESCDYLHSNAHGVVENIKQQTRKEGNEQLRVFDSDGNGAIGYDVYNIKEAGSSYEYKMVGTFGPRKSELNTDQIEFYDKYGGKLSSLSATCGQDLCNKCQHRKTPPPPVEPEKEENASISDFRSSDILLISLVVVLILAVAVIVIALVVCLKKKYKVIEKKLESRDDQIYDEPIRRVYPGHSLPMGANLPFSDPNISPYVFNTTFNRDGVANPTFLSDSDRIESVSQVIANRAMNIEMPYSTSASGNITSQNSILSQAPTLPSPSNQLEIPTMSHLEQQSQISEYSVKPAIQRSDSTENSVVYAPIAASSMPLNAVSLQASQNAHFNSDNVILARGPNGQLIAYISNANAQPTSKQQPFVLQNAQDVVNAEYGPYSRAAALQTQQSNTSAANQEFTSQNMYSPKLSHAIVNDPSLRQSNEMPDSAPIMNNVQVPYENIELQNMNSGRKDVTTNYLGQREALSLKPFSIPTHIISSPTVYSTTVPIQHSSVMPQNNVNSEPILYTENAGIMDLSFQNMLMARGSNQIIPEEDMPEEQWQSHGEIPDNQRATEPQRLYGYPESNSLSSIPDVISGKMPCNPTTPLKTKREVSLESIDLQTNTEQEIQTSPQKLPRKLKKDHVDTLSENSVISMV